MATPPNVFDLWSKANAAAVAAERKVHQAVVDFAYGRNGAPSEDDLQDAFQKRLEAMQAFELVLKEQARLRGELKRERNERTHVTLNGATHLAQKTQSS